MIPLVAPCITRADEDAMVDGACSGSLFRESTVTRFEEAFAARVGCEWAVAVNSGTNALAVALDVVDVLAKAGVVLPSWSCVALRNAANLRGFDIDYVDTEFNVRRAQATQQDAYGRPVVVAHMFGRDTLGGGDDLGTYVEDFTLSLGGCVLNADLGVCSFSRDKMISTGRGGIIFGSGSGMERGPVRELVNYETHTRFGYSVAMSSMQAALGLSQLAQLDTFIDRRRELASRYTEAFRPAGIECPDPDCGSVFFRYLIAVQNPADRVKELAERGIEAGRGVFPPLHQLAGLPDTDYPGTTAAVNSLLSVPVHPSVTDAQAAHIIESVLEVCAP